MAFADNFWEIDFTGTQGYEALVKRLKDGKRMTVDFEDFLKQRAAAEENYAKELMKISKKAQGTCEIGTLRASWDALKSETEACGREHMAASQRLLNELEKVVRDFREKQREVRKRTEDTIKKAQAFKRTAYHHEQKCHAEYITKCKAADKAEETAEKNASLPAKKLEDLRVKAKRARQMSEQADSSYQEAVINLDEARVLWEREMENCCKTFQELEEERIAFMRNTMWKVTNVGSSVSVQEDELFEHVRGVLEHCDVSQDIEQFVSQKRTGNSRPVPVEYENFYGNNPPESIRPSYQKEKERLQQQQQQQLSHTHSVRNDPLPTPPESKPENIEDPVAYGTIGADVAANPTGPASGGSSAVVPLGHVRALYDYSAQGDEEISFREGDVLVVLEKEDDNWWLGTLRGRQGMFPCSYVEDLH